MSKTDKDVRIELSALYRILHMYGMTDLANQCAGARSIENKDCSFVHPKNLFFGNIRICLHYLGRDNTGMLTKKSQNLTMKYDIIKD